MTVTHLTSQLGGVFRMARSNDFMREEIRLNYGSRMPLDCRGVQWVDVLFFET